MRNPKASRWAAGAAACGLLLAAGRAGAQTDVSLTRAGSGARAAGMGDAFIAVSDDGTAASWNPAGLAQLRQPEFSLVYFVGDNGMRYSGMRSPDNAVAFSTQATHYTNASLDFASAAVPFSIAGKPVTIQLGWHRLYRISGVFMDTIERVPLSVPGPTTSVFREDRQDGNIDVLSLAGALRLTSHLALGGGLDLWRGGWTDRQTLIENPGGTGPSALYASETATRLRGHNFTLGLLLIHPKWNVGLVHHTPFSSDYRLRAQVHSTLEPSETFDVRGARLRLPRSFGAGVARRLGPRWTAAVSVTHDPWSGALIEGFPGTDRPFSLFDGAPAELTTTRDTTQVNLGLEHLILREGSVVPLRLGFGWEPQGAMDPVTRDPVTFQLVAVGAGYNTNRFKLDAAVQYRWDGIRLSDTLTVQRALRGGPPDALGNADAREWRIKVSLIYRMADSDALRDLIRRIF